MTQCKSSPAASAPSGLCYYTTKYFKEAYPDLVGDIGLKVRSLARDFGINAQPVLTHNPDSIGQLFANKMAMEASEHWRELKAIIRDTLKDQPQQSALVIRELTREIHYLSEYHMKKTSERNAAKEAAHAPYLVR